MYTLKRTEHEAAAARSWDEETAEFLLASFPGHFAALEATPGMLCQLSAQARRTAEAFRVTEGNQIRRLAVAMVALGAFVTDDPRFWPGIHAALSDYYAKDKTRLNKVSANAQAWNMALWEDDSLAQFGARATLALRRPEAVSAEVLPQQSTLIPADTDQQFLRHAWERARLAGARDQTWAMAFYYAALVHGVGWWEDPQHGRLRLSFEAATGPQDLITRFAAHFERFAT